LARKEVGILTSYTKALLELTAEITKAKLADGVPRDHSMKDPSTSDLTCDFMKKVHQTLLELSEKTEKL